MSQLRPDAFNVAYRFFRKQAAGVERVSGGSRNRWLDAVWDMYVQTYSKIGLHIPNPQGLLKYGIWELNFDGGVPVAFTLYKKTPFGLKSGLSGHDGSQAGKRAAVHNLRTKFREGGIFGEVSHKVKSIALAAGAPVVCAAFADDVTGKRIELTDDPLTYARTLKGVGKVQKTMVGRPKGVPTTDAGNPVCPVGNIDLGDPWEPRTAGGASLLGWGDDVSDEEAAQYDLCAHCSDEAMGKLFR